MTVIFKMINDEIRAFDQVAKLSIVSGCTTHFSDDNEAETGKSFLLEFTKHSYKYIPMSAVKYFEIEDKSVNHYW